MGQIIPEPQSLEKQRINKDGKAWFVKFDHSCKVNFYGDIKTHDNLYVTKDSRWIRFDPHPEEEPVQPLLARAQSNRSYVTVVSETVEELKHDEMNLSRSKSQRS